MENTGNFCSTSIAFCLLTCVTTQGATAAEFDHTIIFPKLTDDIFYISETYYDPSTGWYQNNYNFAKFSGYQDLFLKYGGHLPTGDGLTILQAESFHTPDVIGDVKHLFDFETSNSHSEFVADALTHGKR